MPLASGSRLGPYEILAPLGAGGMGEVYKARDTRLHREVAIKVLPANRVSDPDRKARFIQEARAASSLNHPNIVTIHDISQADGVDFLVMELVPGKTLEQLIGRKGLAVGEALRYALAMADALTKAHAAGIVHRDLKPGNVMITDEGAVKVLDFGLAKLAERGGSTEGLTATIEGTIVGTIAYMSPEQAEGKPVDARSDIFSFGCVLYEMLTGRRAFSGDTQASTLAAVLREEPKAVSEAAAGVPRDLERIIQRCMRKDPARRFQHMVDVKVELEEVKEESDSAPRAAAPPAAPRSRRWAAWAAMGVLALAAAGAVAWLLPRPESNAVQLAPVPLVNDPGFAESPSFSPDGNQVAYVWDGEQQDNRDIYVRLIGSGKPLRLTTDPVPDVAPAWSPDARTIAFIRGWRGIFLVSPLGGGERKVAEGVFPAAGELVSGISWSPDSKLLAVSEVSAPGQPPAIHAIRIEDGEKRRLTTPSTTGDFFPAISPDGRRLAFARCARASYICGLYVVDLTPDYRASGEPRLLGTEGGSIADPVWTADGQDIVYMFGAAGVTHHLMRIRAQPGTEPQRLAFAGDRISGPAIAVRGNRLAYAVNLSDVDIRAIEPGGAVRSLASSTLGENSPQFSPDGKHIAFASDRTGVTEVWVCDRDGANAVQLTRFGNRHSGTPRWSPDGRSIAFDSQLKEGWHIFVMASDSGQSRRLTPDQGTEIIPSWSADGKTIYFASDRSGQNEIWKAPAAGGKGEQVTRDGGYLAFESRDGRSLYYIKGGAGPLWVRPVEGGAEKLLFNGVVSRGFTVESDGIYYLTGIAQKGEASVQFYRFATGQSEPAAKIEERRLNIGLAVSPDRKSFLYAGFTRIGQNLMLVDGFR